MEAVFSPARSRGPTQPALTRAAVRGACGVGARAIEIALRNGHFAQPRDGCRVGSLTEQEARMARSGDLDVTKECSEYKGRAGDFCTITSSKRSKQVRK
jgi:hypothetical protein